MSKENSVAQENIEDNELETFTNEDDSTDPSIPGEITEDRGLEMSTDNETPPTSSSEDQDDDEPVFKVPRWSQKWTETVKSIMAPLVFVVRIVAHLAACNPKIAVGTVIFLSFALPGIGLVTNFRLLVDEGVLWTPIGCPSLKHYDWLVSDESGFPLAPRYFFMLVHDQGKGRVVNQEGIRRAFQALNTVIETPTYDTVCAQTEAYFDVIPETGARTCNIAAVTDFWSGNQTLFEQNTTQASILEKVSVLRYPSMKPVDRNTIFGQWETEDGSEEGKIVRARSFPMRIDLPSSPTATVEFEEAAIKRLRRLNREWAREDDNDFRVEIFAQSSFPAEFERAIIVDMPLLGVVFTIMTIFCCIVFYRRDPIKSQSMLGCGAVICIFLSILSGYGLMFIVGVPFTSLTPMLPFIMFGIGLDDAFIIMGSYTAQDPKKDIITRIDDTIDDIGASILVTTMTSTVAFGLGCSSSIPCVKWLCLYAFPVILIDFLYQITFFIALIVLDDRRAKAGRRDIFWWRFVDDADRPEDQDDDEPSQNFAVKFMRAYVDFLLDPIIRVLVIILFGFVAVMMAFSTMRLTQAFKFTDVIPSDSYVTRFLDRSDEYSKSTFVRPNIVFRDLDFGDPQVREGIHKYVDEFVAMNEISEKPAFFWLRDFDFFINATSPVLDGYSFQKQLEFFMSNPIFNQIYTNDIVLDNDGMMTASRTTVVMDRVNLDRVVSQIRTLNEQLEIAKSQPLNSGLEDLKMFALDENYFIWEFYSVVVSELTQSSVLGVIAVTLIALLFIPHWTAPLFVAPIVMVLYIDLLGFLQIVGMHVNSVTYISMVMSIGLMVDYIMHVVIKYYESPQLTREDKVRNTLETMGASILVGGLSTMLGIVPLFFSASEIFFNVFIVFVGLVLFGVTHGLVLLPAILSLFGPLVHIHYAREEPKKRRRQRKNLNRKDGKLAFNSTSSTRSTS
eukprot:CAMPEP_0118712038 /NCGR_PEP_ID=MMETSP0800-20121206/24515_1 /TAXON_ID=210618 ORGANISM="Striatella unipunctata, Strain CCMP2910" /NCGR_SAMPLE_ID=MMETSP0800 /ASSEMBLY_ACC=CAM_ASM_000638 /LENGTH=954 /DNA_ID=CAMNT_0006616887 /DNA_START=76 /DNA_END=2944 /DNA_ORIENTATION=+